MKMEEYRVLINRGSLPLWLDSLVIDMISNIELNYCLVHICPGRRAINLSTRFFGIVGGYGLRHMCSHCLRASWQFLLSGATRGKYTETVRRLYGNRAMSVQLLSSLHSLRTEIVRSPCGDCAMPPTTCLRATVLRFFQICKTSR